MEEHPLSMELTYLSNSGFLLSNGRTALIFDDEGRCPDVVNRAALQRFDAAVFFVSHGHSDHFYPGVFAFSELPGVRYVLSDDVPLAGLSEGARAARVAPMQQAAAADCRVTAFGSTDLGVSFLVLWNGLSIFHAGDLNNWHWRAESTDDEVREAQRAFDAIVSQIPRPIDLAFFPVDPRMGPGYDLGARQFAARIRPRLFVPMHFREAAYAATDFQSSLAVPGVRVLPLTESGRRCELPFDAAPCPTTL